MCGVEHVPSVTCETVWPITVWVLWVTAETLQKCLDGVMTASSAVSEIVIVQNTYLCADMVYNT